MEICDETLFDYLEKKNQKISSLRKNKSEQTKAL
jgi:hypothetical protein